MRIAACATLAVLASLTLASGGAGKDGARARLLTPLPLAAKPGSAVVVRWAVDVPDGEGGRRPFGAGGMFVRLLSRTGAPSTVGLADGTGRFETTLRVPAGGIGGVRVGLRGTRCDANGCRPSDALFPLENNPFRSPDGARCDVAALRATLAAFVQAYNRGDLRTLNRVFASEPRFKAFSSGGAARGNRGALIDHLRRRHERGDRLSALTYRFNGYETERDLGHFQFEALRRADDLVGGRRFEVAGKGALDCAAPPVTIALMLLTRQRPT
ncbi:MAG TPA: hypothetical protein VH950_10515 [Gaiellaceae bacterium]